MVIPSKCYHGLTISLKGYGRESKYSQLVPISLQKKRGDLLVKLLSYPDSITPQYCSFEYLSTENMALEGWVYRKFDDVIQKMGMSSFPVHPIKADEIANLFNGWSWTSIFHALVRHLELEHLNLRLEKSDSILLPGSCERTVTHQGNTPVASNYKITINEQFIDNPFSVAAILAHELCHVVYYERFEDTPKLAGYQIKSDQATLEMERTVDLLVFMYKIGEFQLRVARDKRLTIGYFNQEIFERIQVIVSRKLNES